MLGQGQPFFADLNQKRPMKLLATKTFKSGVVALRYAPEQP
jgi:hypothetical protein